MIEAQLPVERLSIILGEVKEVKVTQRGPRRTRVDVAADALPALLELLQSSGNDDFEVVFVPDLGEVIQRRTDLGFGVGMRRQGNDQGEHQEESAHGSSPLS